MSGLASALPLQEVPLHMLVGWCLSTESFTVTFAAQGCSGMLAACPAIALVLA